MDSAKTKVSTHRQSPLEGTLREGKYPLWVYAFLPALLTALFYWSLFKNGFVGWDDPDMILNNIHIRNLDFESIQWMFSNFHAGYWIPMTWLSYALDFLIGRLDPALYHFTNLFLHLLNTALVFQVCHKILKIGSERSGSDGVLERKISEILPAFITALLFGLHPIQVETVAWASERKGVLCAFFYLLALWFYLKYAAALERKASFYWACFGFFLLALMSKPMAVTLPFVLLILDGWPLGRIRKDFFKVIAEKALFFVLILSDGILTAHFYAQVNVLQTIENFPWYFRVLTAFRSLGFYLEKMALPLDLVPLYPLPRTPNNVYYLEGALAAALVVFLSVLCFSLRNKRPYLAAAWFFYLVTLGPVLGILKLGYHAAADRYAYLPCVGVFFLLSVWISPLILKHRAVGFGVFAVIMGLLGFLTAGQIGVWNNTTALWETVVRHYPDDSPSFVYSNLGASYQVAGRSEDAMREYDAAIALPPPWPSAHNGKGTLLFDRGKREEAVQEFKTAISLDANYAPAHKNLAAAYQKMGMNEEAQTEMREALRIEQEAH